MNKSSFKGMICLMLIAALALMSVSAFAVTGQEVLGLGSSTGSGSGDSGADGDIYGNDAGTSTGRPTLQMGDQDGVDSSAYVVMLQNRLIALGYLASTADGQFGANTEKAVAAFQENNGLTATGIADQSTQAVLYSDAAQRASQADIAESSTLRVQQMLSTWGFLVGTPDGVAGDATNEAVSAFKEYLYTSYPQQYAVYATPVPTPAATPAPDEQPECVDVPLNATADTLENANGYSGEITDDVLAFANGESSFQIFQTLVQSGDKNADTWRVQRRLRQLGYLYKPDGSYGNLTKYALMYFQTKNGLQATGTADQATQELLFSDSAIKSEEYVFPYKIYVSISNQRVYIMQWDGSGYNTKYKQFKCSTGKSGYDTPTGTYQSGGKVTSGMWYYFTDFNCYAKYAYRIVGGVLFHSVLYNSSKKVTNSSVSALGRKASHGCIRLAVEDAQFIFENCPEGTTIVIQD